MLRVFGVSIWRVAVTISREPREIGYVAEGKEVTLEILCVDPRKFLSGELVESCGWCTGVPVCW